MECADSSVPTKVFFLSRLHCNLECNMKGEIKNDGMQARPTTAPRDEFWKPLDEFFSKFGKKSFQKPLRPIPQSVKISSLTTKPHLFHKIR